MSFELYNLDKDYPIKQYQLFLRYCFEYDDNSTSDIEIVTFYFDSLSDCFHRLKIYSESSDIRIISFSVAELSGFPIEHDNLIQLIKEYNDEI